jgi:D-alanyl-D-alanine carboxypeptidase
MQRVAKLIDRLVGTDVVLGASVTLFKERDITSIYCAGSTGVGPHDSKFNENTKIRVASISKLAVALAILRLVDMDMVTICDDVSGFLGFPLRHPNWPNHRISIADVLCHRSGVRDVDDYKGLIQHRLSDYFSTLSPNWVMDAISTNQQCYANFNSGILAQVIENISSMRFDHAVKELLFRPLGLDCGFSEFGDPHKVKNWSPIFRRVGQNWIVQCDENGPNSEQPVLHKDNHLFIEDYKIGTNGLVFSPQGGLRASMVDVAELGMVLSGANEFLSNRLRKQMMEIRPEDDRQDGVRLASKGERIFKETGLGIQILVPGVDCPVPKLSTLLIGHAGYAYGFFGGVWIDPISQSGFSWCVNGSKAVPDVGKHSNFTFVEESVMGACAQELGLVYP